MYKSAIRSCLHFLPLNGGSYNNVAVNVSLHLPKTAPTAGKCAVEGLTVAGEKKHACTPSLMRYVCGTACVAVIVCTTCIAGVN